MSSPPIIQLPIPVPKSPFGPSTWPSGNLATDNWTDSPLNNQPLQLCRASDQDGGAYLWNRGVGCYIALPGTFTVSGTNWADINNDQKFLMVDPSICTKYNTDNKSVAGLNTFPAYRASAGAALPYQYNGFNSAVGTAAFPRAAWQYSNTPSCQAAYNVGAWDPRTPLPK